MILERKHHICLFALAVFDGIILYCRAGSLWMPLAIAISAATVFGLFCGGGDRERLITGIIALGLALTAFMVCRYQDHSYNDIQKVLAESPPADISGKVFRKEIRSDNYVYYLRTAYKKIMVYCDSDGIPVGAEVTVRGDISLFAHATNEGQFDFADDYRYQNISCRIYAYDMEDVREPAFCLREGLYRLKKGIGTAFFMTLNEAEAGVMATLCVGSRGLLDSEVKAMYQQAGISHILAISGLHISILGMGIYRFLRKIKCPCRVCEGVGCAVVLLFVIMSGASTSSVRALVMYFVMMGSRTFGRGYDTLNSLAIAAILLLLPHPMSLYRSGFLFSFTAIGAIVIYNVIQKKTAQKRKKKIKDRESNFSENDRKIFRNFINIIKNGSEDDQAGKSRDADLSKDRFGLIQKIRYRASILAGKFIRGLGQRCAMGAFLQLFLMPLTAWVYYEVPIYSMFLNLVVLPLCSALLGFGMAGGILGMVFPEAAKWVLVPCHFILRIYEFSVGATNRLPLHQLITGRPAAGMMFLYYAVLLSVCIIYVCSDALSDDHFKTLRVFRFTFHSDANASRSSCLQAVKVPVRSALSSLIAKIFSHPLPGFLNMTDFFASRCYVKKSYIIALYRIVPLGFLACILFVTERQPCRIDFLDVGQGDGIYISDGSGVSVMIDGGSSSVSGVGKYRIEPFLKYHGVRKVNAWIVTHSDSDHYSGLLEILEDGYTVDCLIFSESCPEDEGWESLVEAAESNGTEVVYASAGAGLALTDCEMTCLYPAADDSSDDTNALSQVWSFEKDGLSVLFTGDIGEEQEELLIERGLLEDYTVLKCAHHGSKYSSCEDFLSVISPEYTIISCGKNNIYGHPHSETLERLEAAGSEIIQTQYSGQITICEKREGFIIRGFITE